MEKTGNEHERDENAHRRGVCVGVAEWSKTVSVGRSSVKSRDRTETDGARE